METAYLSLLELMGEDPNRPGLIDTPKRASGAMQYLTSGYREDIDELLNGALFDSGCDEMIVVKDIELYSLCEHHLLPFIGRAHVGYVPQGKILGLSKIARIVDHYAKRLQVQENLTKEIADCIMKVTGALGVGVIIEAKHLCMMMRGVEKQNSQMTTSVTLGCFRSEDSCRAEFMTLVKS